MQFCYETGVFSVDDIFVAGFWKTLCDNDLSHKTLVAYLYHFITQCQKVLLLSRLEKKKTKQ